MTSTSYIEICGYLRSRSAAFISGQLQYAGRVGEAQRSSAANCSAQVASGVGDNC
jgi:hypothetical protein